MSPLSEHSERRRKADYASGSSARKLPQTLSKDEVAALMLRPNLNCPTGLRNMCLLLLMHRSGLRVSEACGVYLRDVRWSERRLHIRGAVAKGGREAWVSLDDLTLPMLERWKAIRRQYAGPSPWLFTTLKGNQIDRRYVWEMVRRYAGKAGIEKQVWPHMLRHTFATELLGEGFNIREVQELLRHSNVQTTSIYLHVQDAELHAKIRRRTA